MTKTRLLATWSTVVLGLALAGCSSDNNPAAPPGTSLQGHFKLFLETLVPSVSPEVGPLPVFFDQTGGALNGLGGTGTVSGMGVSFASSDPSFPLQFSGTASAPTSPTVTGTFSVTGTITANGNFRLEPMTPTGDLSSSGMVNGNTIAITSTVAIGQRLYDDVALTTLNAVAVTHAEADIELELEFTNPSALAVGTLAVPALPVTVSYSQDILLHEFNATGGSVTVTKYDGTGFTGMYTLMLGSGETVTGSFDVVWDIDAYDP